MKRLTARIITLLMILSVPAAAKVSASAGMMPVYEEPVYQSFNYIRVHGSISAVEAPIPYSPAYMADSVSMGTDISEPVDLFFDGDTVYIADRGGNRIICADEQFRVLSVITGFMTDAGESAFLQPEGVYAVNGKLYIADTGNHRIVVLNNDLSCAAIITEPDSEILPDDLIFAPVKVAADGTGRVYAVIRGVYEGIMELYIDGSFGGFIGSIPVSPDPITLLWKNFMTKEQREKLESFIPLEYTNLTVDAEGFVYTVSLASEDGNAVRRLNAAGNDILNRSSLGYIPTGGVVISPDDSKTPPSDFVDVAVDGNGLYHVLDNRYGRIFSYDANGNMLFAFGGKNTGQNGTFQKPGSIAVIGDRIAVLDSGTASVTVFERTDYASLVLNSIVLYNSDRYQESIESWNHVLQYNSSFALAYSYTGRALYQLGSYREAMDQFRRASDQENYSKAFGRVRGQIFTEYFPWIIGGLVAAVIAIYIAVRLIRRMLKRHPLRQGGPVDSLLYVFYVIFHPFDGFWDLKHEKRGRTWVAVLLVALTVLAFTLRRSVTGFSLIAILGVPVDIIFELKFVLVPLALFIVANMSVTTLMDGKGTLRQVFVASCYAIAPLTLINLPLTLISNLMTRDEAMYVSLLGSVAVLWTALLLFSALLGTHEYAAGKTVGTVVITGAAMVIICFICVLFFSLLSELVGFVYTISEEMRFRS